MDKADRADESLRMLRQAAEQLKATVRVAETEDRIRQLESEVDTLTRAMFEHVATFVCESYQSMPYEIARAIVERVWREMPPDVTTKDYSDGCVRAAAAWLDTHWKIPKGFTAIPFRTWIELSGGYSVIENVAKKTNLSEDDLYAHLGRMAGEDKIRFCRHVESRQPAVFLAQRKDSNFQEWPEIEVKIGESLLSEFETEGVFDTNTGTIEPPIPVAEWFDRSAADVGRMCEDAKISRRVAREILEGFHASGALTITRVSDGFRVHLRVRDASTMSESQRRIADSLLRLFAVEDNSRREIMPRERTYAEAIEKQYAALAHLVDVSRLARTEKVLGLGLKELTGHDIEALRIADTFAWFEDPINAVEAASISLPNSARLTRELTPGSAGWWYFMRPLELSTLDESHEVIALLWKWNDIGSFEGAPQSGIYFSLYVEDPKGVLGPTPTTKFFWVDGESVEHMLARNRREYLKRYGPGGDLNSFPLDLRQGVELTCAIIERIARFFAAGCLWIEQRIVVSTPRPIERHARKRMERDAFRRELRDIQIIQLRRRQSVASRAADTEPNQVAWSCRWVVSGHWRNQYYPSKGAYREKWIDPYDKGPEGLPFKSPSHKVYAVKR